MRRVEQPQRTMRTSVEKEMAKPRVTKSARIAQLNLDTDRTSEPPSTSMPGTVVKIIPSRHLGKPAKAQISLDADEKQYRDFRIKNSLTDEHGDDVKLKKGAPVEVTIAAKNDGTPE
jgi:hypothetical protein